MPRARRRRTLDTGPRLKKQQRGRAAKLRPKGKAAARGNQPCAPQPYVNINAPASAADD